MSLVTCIHKNMGNGDTHYLTVDLVNAHGVSPCVAVIHQGLVHGEPAEVVPHGLGESGNVLQVLWLGFDPSSFEFHHFLGGGVVFDLALFGPALSTFSLFGLILSFQLDHFPRHSE